MRKWMRKSAASVLAVSLLIGQAVSANAWSVPEMTESLKIAVLSDTHYLSPDMIADTQDFTDHLNSDRKMFAESDVFLTALLDTVKQDDPDVLLISGDLTKDGELEGHQALAEKLETFREEIPDLHIYITPGNHDLNNSNAMNFNTESGKAEPAGRTEPDDYKEIYSELTYNDETVTEVFVPAEGKTAGGLSYAARPKDGFTIISIDSARYSADNTESGTDEHETSGAISADLEKWVVSEITKAKQRGDTVIGLQHHGLIPHFGMEPELLPMYLVNDYERLSTVFADAGMQYVFTGHMHANDIAVMTTKKGSTLYDIETGSVVTYPSPARFAEITRVIKDGKVNETLEIKTHTGVNAGSFENPATGELQTIEDISAYGKQHGFSNDMLITTVNGFLNSYYSQINAAGGSKKAVEALLNGLLAGSLPADNLTIEQMLDMALPRLTPDVLGEEIYYDSSKGGIVINMKVSAITFNLLIPAQGLKSTLNVLLEKLDREVLEDPSVLDSAISELIKNLTKINVAPDGENKKTLLDYANYIYQSHLGGEDSTSRPEWVAATSESIESGTLLAEVLKVVIADVSKLLDSVLANVTFEELVGSTEWDQVNLEFIPSEKGRTPLLSANDEKGGGIPMVIGILGAKWTAVNEGGKTVKYVAPAGTVNPELGYTLHDFIYSIRLLRFNMEETLTELLLGTPAEGDAPAEEGILTAELQSQLNDWLYNVVDTMGADDNYPEDNNTTVTGEWKLLTDRTALDTAIEKAEGLDLGKYTEASSNALISALEDAKALKATAPQTELDRAASDLNYAVNALVANSAGNGGDSDDGNITENVGNTNTGGGSSLPVLGENHAVLPLILLFISGVAAAVTFLIKRKISGR